MHANTTIQLLLKLLLLIIIIMATIIIIANYSHKAQNMQKDGSP